MPEIHVLQTPLKEERGNKRDREESTPVSGLVEQPGEKRQRLNPYSEEELLEETTSIPRGEGRTEHQTPPNLETSASSYQQELERHHNVEITSTRPQNK